MESLIEESSTKIITILDLYRDAMYSAIKNIFKSVWLKIQSANIILKN